MKTHELKTDSAVFEAVVSGKKRFEIRKNDRDFQEGDEVYLRETQWTGLEMQNGSPLIYTGRSFTSEISYVLDGPIYGLAVNWCIFQMK